MNTDVASQTRRLRVFLCHASADKTAVRQLHRRLKDDGFEPWLDEEDLLPGQVWEFEIAKAVRDSDVIVVCLSQSFHEAGYRQKEIKLALDLADQQPEGKIFLIPLKLEECDVPQRLSQWQWVALFSDGGYERLVHALQVRAGLSAQSHQTASTRRHHLYCSISCQPPIVAAEGLTETIGELVLTITREHKSSIPRAARLDVEVVFNTPITNKLYNSGLSSAMLMLATPSSRNRITYGKVSGSCLLFEGLELEWTAPEQEQHVFIRNVQVNATAVASLYNPTSDRYGEVHALIVVHSDYTVVTQNPQLVVATVTPSFAFTLRNAENTDAIGTAAIIRELTALDKKRIATLRYCPAFSHAFQIRLAKDFGTRLKAAFNNVPVGLDVFVSTENINHGSDLQSSKAVLTNSEYGPFQYVFAEAIVDGIRVTRLPISNGSATAIWEVTRIAIPESPTFDFGLYVSFDPSLEKYAPIGTGTVSGSLAPLYTSATGGLASETLPTPRYVDTSRGVHFITVMFR